FMGKRTIAEYVENDEILTILREIGVDFAQGFGVGRKIPLTALLPAELGSTYSRSTRK
ncbi:MAG: EAL domain-containing protein, partial [SAR86 cluster bacterium]|nr:EAL domain-containing protein [SAR86 cluster bacterium]